MKPNPLFINLGCGLKAHAAWVNIDYSRAAPLKKLPFFRRIFTSPLPPNYLNHNLRYGIPFADNTASAVYSSHLLEHLYHDQAALFCKEQWRVLKPGGVIRVVVPDLEGAAARYIAALQCRRKDGESGRLAHEWATIYLMDQFVRRQSGGEMRTWLQANRETPFVREMEGVIRDVAQDSDKQSRLRGFVIRLLGMDDPVKTGEMHRWMYDEVSLQSMLASVGFSSIKRLSSDESSIPGWENFHLDRAADGELHQPGSLYIEGLK